jgi:2-keto-4-pentenoate hydratase
MKQSKTEAAARLLLSARHGATPLPDLPPEYVPNDLAQAYAIQDAVAAELGPIGGWKVGAQGPMAIPTCAPLPASRLHTSPHILTQRTAQRHGVEAEIALMLKQDLPPRPQPYSLLEVIAAIGSVHPAIEIVESRYEDSSQVNALSKLADAQSNGALVYGIGRNALLNIDQTVQPVELYFNKKMVASAVGGNPAGDVLRLLVWLANHLTTRCGGLRTGQIVTTGSCTGLLFVEVNTQVHALFPGLGSAELSIAANARND